MALPCLSQHAESNSIYKKLDVFLEQPSTQNLQSLKNQLESISVNDQSVQLAKTIAYCNMGYIERKNNSFQEAINFYEKAKQLYFTHNLNGYDIIEYCLKPLGNLYTKTRALTEAENTIKHYLILAQETGKLDQEISAILNLSVIYQNRGEFKKAIRLLQRGLKKAPNHRGLQLNLATNYFSIGNKSEAKTMAIKLIVPEKDNTQAYQLLSEIYRAEKKYNKAIYSLKSAMQSAKQNPETSSRQRARILLAMAETYFVNKNNQQAIQTLHKVYLQLLPTYQTAQKKPKEEQLYAETTLMDALDLHAAIFEAKDNPQKTIETFEMASIVNDYLFAQLATQKSKLLVQQNVKSRAEKMLGICYQQYKKTNDEEWLKKAIKLDNRIKGQVVSDAVTLKKKLSSKASQYETQFQELQKKLARVNNQIQELTNSVDPDYKNLVSLQKTYSALLTRQRMLYDQIQHEFSDKRMISTSLEEIKQRATHTGKTLVSYFLGEKKGYQFTISKEQTRFEKLTSSEAQYENFLNSIRKYNHFFQDPSVINNDIPAFTNTSYTLFKQLKLPKADSLIIIPDGLLTFVPFQTLLTKTTKSKVYQDMPFLIFDHSISYAVSFQQFLETKNHFSEKQSVLGLFPVFKNTPQELSYSVLEATAIEDLFPSKLLMESDATAKSFIKDAEPYSILHISTHALGGTFNNEPEIQFSDRSLSLEELYGLQLDPQLVVLSACETGVGKVIKGEGALSLARGFQYAGAPNIVFSLWQVNDKSTAELMKYFYKNLKKSHSRDGSVQQASLDYIKDNTIANPQKSPYYWGAFVYYGSTDKSQHQNTNHKYLLIITGILIFCVLIWLARRNL